MFICILHIVSFKEIAYWKCYAKSTILHCDEYIEVNDIYM